MQSMPLLLRQSLRSSLQLTRTTSRPVQVPHLRPTPPSAFPAKPTTRSFSVCLQCQFRRLPGSYSPVDEKDKTAAEIERIAQALREGVVPDGVPGTDAAAGSLRASSTETDVPSAEQAQTKIDDKILLEGIGSEEKQGKAQNTNAEGRQTGGLPSYLENRRSQLSKQFTTMMDNLQSNVFVAGQRLNDLTGYSAIEALKKDIQIQGKNDIQLAIQHPAHSLTTLLFPFYRGPTPHCSHTCPQSQGRLHSRNQQPLHLPARSQRASPAQARLVPNRPGTLHPALPQRPHQRGCRDGDARGPVSCRA